MDPFCICCPAADAAYIKDTALRGFVKSYVS